jgi:hypothetical protein
MSSRRRFLAQMGIGFGALLLPGFARASGFARKRRRRGCCAECRVGDGGCCPECRVDYGSCTCACPYLYYGSINGVGYYVCACCPGGSTYVNMPGPLDLTVYGNCDTCNSDHTKCLTVAGMGWPGRVRAYGTSLYTPTSTPPFPFDAGTKFNYCTIGIDSYIGLSSSTAAKDKFKPCTNNTNNAKVHVLPVGSADFTDSAGNARRARLLLVQLDWLTGRSSLYIGHELELQPGNTEDVHFPDAFIDPNYVPGAKCYAINVNGTPFHVLLKKD